MRKQARRKVTLLPINKLTRLYREKAQALLVELGISAKEIDFEGVGEIEPAQHGARVPLRIFIYYHEIGA